MKVVYPNIFPDDPTLKLNFESLDTSDSDNIILHIDPRNDFEREPNKKYYCLDLELPNGFLVIKNDYINFYENKYDKIFTICPYTVKKRNKALGRELYQYVYFPSNSNWNRINEKDIDVIYVGSGAEWILNDSILKFNYRVINKFGGKYVTEDYVNFDEKHDLISRSKIAIVHNILNVDSWPNLTEYDDFFEVRSEVVGFKTITQQKSRIVEAARCRTLLLCKEDDFNIIEDFFTPNVDFIYFNNNNLGEKIEHILNNYDDYQYMIENAFLKVSNNYDIHNFYQNYILNK
jgi:hypothetical protein